MHDPDEEAAPTITKILYTAAKNTLPDDDQAQTKNNQGDIMAVTERPRQDEDPEIESLDAARSSDTSEDIESVEIAPKPSPPKASRPYKKTTAINSADTRREVTITVGGRTDDTRHRRTRRPLSHAHKNVEQIHAMAEEEWKETRGIRTISYHQQRQKGSLLKNLGSSRQTISMFRPMHDGNPT